MDKDTFKRIWFWEWWIPEEKAKRRVLLGTVLIVIATALLFYHPQCQYALWDRGYDYKDVYTGFEQFILSWYFVLLLIVGFIGIRLVSINKVVLAITITALVSVMLSYGLYSNFLKITHCKCCGKEVKGNYSYCSKRCYERCGR
jgi:hypothetical protein